MSNVVHRKIEHSSRSDKFHIIPLGDIHMGNAACDERLLQDVINGIARHKNTYWIGMGDYAEFINLHDPRWEPSSLAPWITTADIVDLAGAQSERFLRFVKPIASKCLGMIKGNHEDAIERHCERDIYSHMAAEIKRAGGFEAEYKMKLGYYGWLLLTFERIQIERVRITLNLHHGFGGGKLKGGKALTMERWLYTHDCNLAIFGHCHNADSYRAGVEYIGHDDLEHTQTRKGVYSGTFMSGATYAERAGYLPLPLGGVEIVITPGLVRPEDRVRIVT
jgi:hypothetical protein